MDTFSHRFQECLRNHDRAGLRMIPKADLHNHFVLGGSRSFLKEQTGADILPLDHPLASMAEMDGWSRRFIGARFDSPAGRRLLIDATFVQAAADGVTVLEIGEDVWGLNEFFGGDVGALTDAFEQARARYAPHTELRLQIGLSRHCPIEALEEWLRPFWGHPAFYSIDLYGDELAQPIDHFIPLYRRAEEEGLILKAHLGEWGTAQDVKEGAEKLHLHEIQHGIAAARDSAVMDFLREKNIRLHITPTSNRMLGRVPDLAHHPIAVLFRAGVPVTIGSDDILPFDSDVSGEYLRLWESGCLTAGELDEIRCTGLSPRLTDR